MQMTGSAESTALSKLRDLMHCRSFLVRKCSENVSRTLWRILLLLYSLVLGSNLNTQSGYPVLKFCRVVVEHSFRTFVCQVKRFLAPQLPAGRSPLKKPSVKGRKVIAPEIPCEQPTKEITVGLANSRNAGAT